MSIISSVQTWLETFDGMELRPINNIQTDKAEENPSSYSLAPSGNNKTKEDILGNKIFTNNYVFYARESTSAEVDRSENYDFIESLTDWIEVQRDAKNFPVLSGQYKVEEIEVSNGFLFDIDEDSGVGTYQVQIQITIRKGEKFSWQ